MNQLERDEFAQDMKDGTNNMEDTEFNALLYGMNKLGYDLNPNELRELL